MKQKTKKGLSLMLTAMMLMSNIAYASNDISGHWASETMTKWQSQGLLKGDEKGNLNPDNSITRAEFVTIVNKAMSYSKTGDKIKNYNDVKQNDWYYNQIMTALEQGYINGTSNNKMSPNKSITRQEVMLVVNSIAELNQSKFDLSVVKDQDKIASWARNAATNMLANGYISGYQGNINPNNPMKRAEAITLLDSFKQNNRTISFQGEYNLGKANKVTILTGNIKINDSQIKELVINKNAIGTIDFTNTTIEKVTDDSHAVKMYIDGKEAQIQDQKLTLQEMQTNNDKKYKDGKYTGKSKGYNSDVEVEVEIKDDKIIKIDVKQKEDQIYWNLAKKVIDKIIEKQTPKVDASAGATISSKAIMYAVEEALDKAMIKKQEVKSNQNLKDGKYIGEATGFNGILKVQVEIKDSKILDIKLISHSDDSGYIEPAQNILKDIMKKQSAEVEAVAGATYSSNGIKNAVKDALEQAKGNTTKPGQSTYAMKNQQGGSYDGGSGSADPKIEKDFSDLVDGVYEGEAKGYDPSKNIKVRVTVTNGKISKIQLLEHNESKGYFDAERADKIANQILNKQSTKEVDTISGSTVSSNGFINAIANALENAGKTKVISEDTDGKAKTILTGKIIGKNITVKNLTVNEDLTIEKQVEDADVTLKDMTIKGNLYIYGGGSNSVRLKNVTVHGRTVIEKTSGQKVRFVAEEKSDIKGTVQVNTASIIETAKDTEINEVEISRSYLAKEQTQIGANIKKLDIKAEKANIKVEKQSKIKEIVLPKKAGEYKKDQKTYKKDDFSLEIEDNNSIQSGSNNVEGTFKFLTREELKNLDSAKVYKDGQYFGDGFGFVERKPIPVKVTISGGKITNIELVEDELNKVDIEAKPGQRAKIDDGNPYEARFEIINNLVINKQKPYELAYRLGVLREVYKLARKGAGATDIENYNKNFDKLIGKHEFGHQKEKLKKGDEDNINNKVLRLINTYLVEDLGYDKAEYDAVSGATFTAIGTSEAIANALRKADDSINFYDMRIKDGYKVKFVEGTAIDLSGLKVDFYLKDKTVKTVGYSEFEANGLKVLDRDTDKEIKNGTILNKENFGGSTLSVVNLKVVHKDSNSVKLLKSMQILKGGVIANIQKVQVKARDLDEWIDTTGFNNTSNKGQVEHIQHLTIAYDKAQSLLNKELELRIVAKRADNNKEVILTTRPTDEKDKFIYPQKPNKEYRIYINEDSLKDADGTTLKVDEGNSNFFIIHLKDDSVAPKIADTYKEQPNALTVTTGTMLTANNIKSVFDNLPANSKISFDEDKAKELTKTVGDYKELDVNVEFSDYSSKDYKITIHVKPQGHTTDAQAYNETPFTITTTTNTILTVDRVKNALPNLPLDTGVEITKQADTSKVGSTDVVVRLTFKDSSTKSITIPVVVKGPSQGLAGKFEQNENLLLTMETVVQLDKTVLSSYKNFAEILEIAMKLGEFNKENIKNELRLRPNIGNKDYGDIDNNLIKINILQEPNQKVIGKSKGKIKLTFKDDTDIELDVDVNVTPIPVIYFNLRPLQTMKKSYGIDEMFDFNGLRGFVSVSTEKNYENKWTETGRSMFVPYKDFKYFGLKVVKTGTTQEIKQGSPVKDALTDGKIDLSVYREPAVITQDENLKQIPQITGLDLKQLASNFDESSYAANGIQVETFVKPDNDKFKNLTIYATKGFEPSLKAALKNIESEYGDVVVERLSEPDLKSV